MKKTRGIVMKTSKKATILYTESGDYLKIKTPKATPTLGQVLEIELPVHKPLSHRFFKFGSVAAILLLALSLSVFNLVSGANAAVAAVVMDTDTSMELLIDRNAEVLKVIEITQGAESQSSNQLEGMDIYTAVNLLIDKADRQGAFKQADSLMLTSIVTMDNQSVDVIDQAQLRESIERHMLENNISANMMVNTTDENTLKEAKGLGMSVNQYQIFKRILEKGLMVTIDDSKSKDALNMLTEANTNLITLFPTESVTISPQSGIHDEMSNSMGNFMTGESAHSNDSTVSGANQSLPYKADESTTSGLTMPESQHKRIDPSESMPIPMQGNLESSEGSGEHQMMP